MDREDEGQPISEPGGGQVTVHGDLIQGDRVAGDQIGVGDIASSKGLAIGRGARATVVEGDLVISVGAREVTIPRWAQVAVVALLLGVAALVVLQVAGLHEGSRVRRLTGDLGVAVAQFQVSGQGEGLAGAKDLAQSFSNAILREVTPLGDELGQLVSVLPPEESGGIRGTTEGERAERAHDLAERANAHVVIYGTIEVEGLAATVRPEIYVRGDEFAFASEVTGQYRLGSPLLVEKADNPRRRQEASEQVAARVRALTLVLYGLADYTVGEYADAGQKFEEALATETPEMADVIQVMLCNAELGQGDLAAAEGHCREAIAANPGYSRAYLGLGRVLYDQAAGGAGDGGYESVDVDLLDRSLEAYRQAMDPGLDQPPLADIPAKAGFGLGRAYVMRALAGASAGSGDAEADLARAMEAYDGVLRAYERAGVARLEPLAAYTYAARGLVYRLRSEWSEAASSYEQALELLPRLEANRTSRAAYEAALAEIYGELGQPDKARDWLQRAVDDAPAGSGEKSDYQQRLEQTP